MNLIKTFLLLIPILFTYSSWGHGDHHLPGAKPPAPHGGTVEKAAVTTKTKHSHGQKNIHNHADTKKAAIFFEVNLKKDILNIYALMLDAETHKTYSTIKTSDFRNFKIKIVDARNKKVYLPTITPGKDSWTTSFKKIKGRRFFIYVSANKGNDSYSRKIQVERK